MSQEAPEVRKGRKYIAVPRAVAAKWWHCPFSAMEKAAETNVDGIALVVDPGQDREYSHIDSDSRQEEKWVEFVDEFPYYVRGAMVFRPSGRHEGFGCDDVAALHTQGW